MSGSCQENLLSSSAPFCAMLGDCKLPRLPYSFCFWEFGSDRSQGSRRVWLREQRCYFGSWAQERFIGGATRSLRCRLRRLMGWSGSEAPGRLKLSEAQDEYCDLWEEDRTERGDLRNLAGSHFWGTSLSGAKGAPAVPFMNRARESKGVNSAVFAAFEQKKMKNKFSLSKP